MWFLIALGVVVLVLAYVRLAPSDPDRWHQAAMPSGTESKEFARGYVWRKPITGDGRAEMARLDQVAMVTDRTERLAGSVEAQQITYVTRSKVFGFPDYTTVSVIGGPDGTNILEIYGRLRFGRSDLGVNANRVKSWVAAAQL